MNNMNTKLSIQPHTIDYFSNNWDNYCFLHSLKEVDILVYFFRCFWRNEDQKKSPTDSQNLQKTSWRQQQKPEKTWTLVLIRAVVIWALYIFVFFILAHNEELHSTGWFSHLICFRCISTTHFNFSRNSNSVEHWRTVVQHFSLPSKDTTNRWWRRRGRRRWRRG